MGKPETRRQRRIQKQLRERYPGIWLFKTHGSEYQPAGLPDLIGCLRGRFFGLEVKEPGEEASAIQDETIADIVAAGGIAGVIETFEEAVALLESSFVCPRCGAVSHNPNDIRERYCGRCHVFT